MILDCGCLVHSLILICELLVHSLILVCGLLVHAITIMNATTLLYNRVTLLWINAVHLYLCLTYLSAMTKSDG